MNEILRSIYHLIPFGIWMIVFGIVAMVGGLFVSYLIVITIDIINGKVGELYENLRKRYSSDKEV